MPVKDPLWFTIVKRGALLALVAAIVWFGLGWYRGHALAAAFPEAQLIALEERLLVGEPLLPGDRLPPRTGKVVVVIPSTWKKPADHGGYRPYRSAISADLAGQMERLTPPELFQGSLDLPAGMRAETLDEAATVVFCEPNSTVAGTYVDQRSGAATTAMIRDANLRAFDRATGRQLGACHVNGGPLKMLIHSEEESSTTAPDLIQAVAKMPLVDIAKLPKPEPAAH